MLNQKSNHARWKSLSSNLKINGNIEPYAQNQLQKKLTQVSQKKKAKQAFKDESVSKANRRLDHPIKIDYNSNNESSQGYSSDKSQVNLEMHKINKNIKQKA